MIIWHFSVYNEDPINEALINKALINEAPEYIWKQFEKIVDLHSFYFENLIKAASFSFGIIGIILTYLVKIKIDSGIKNGGELFASVLQIPLILSIGTSIIFAIGTLMTLDFYNKVKDFRRDYHFKWRPHVEILSGMSFVFFILFAIIAVGIRNIILDPSILQFVVEKCAK
jgi:hypothetical protein